MELVEFILQRLMPIIQTCFMFHIKLSNQWSTQLLQAKNAMIRAAFNSWDIFYCAMYLFGYCQ